MSGIFGIVRQLPSKVTEAELVPMADALRHRGPDNISYNARENAGMGHCMLFSTPEALHEILPFREAVSGLTITADARIDNRKQLIADLAVHQSGSKAVTDSQLILYAYMKWGEACVEHLLGDFAFAIWNERLHSLFVARDHMGCKPFYYHCSEGQFVFSSSAMAIARVLGAKATLNEGRVADYLVEELEGIDNTCTWYNEISRMPPAHCAYYRNNRFQARRYWWLEPVDLSQLKTDEDYLAAFTEVYTDAVRCRLRCQTKPASMLSGGLDSSTMTALARDMLVAEGKSALRTYSGISDAGQTCPETQSVEAIIVQGKLTPKCFRPSDSDTYSAGLVAAMLNMEDPFDASWPLLSLMFLGTARDGGRSVLDGLDGDLSMGVPTSYIRLVMGGGDWRGAWREACGYSQHYYRGYFSASSLYLRAFRSLVTPGFLRGIKKKLGATSRYRNLMKDKLILRAFADRVKLPSRLLKYERSLSPPDVGFQAWHKHVMQVPYLTAATERYERIASYFGVEARHPLLDIRLMAFSAALPMRYKVRDGWSKYMLRLLAQERLPENVAWREGSESLSWDFTERLTQQYAIKPGFPQASLEKSLSSWVNTNKLEKTLPEYKWDYYSLHQWLAQSGQSILK